MKKEDIKLYDLVDYQNPRAVLKEIIHINALLNAQNITERFYAVYEDVNRLFKGEYPGYRASNTKYHNLEHTIMVTLTTARLVHGCVKGRLSFHPENILLSLIAALYHDAGLIQTNSDRKGTGAKYTIGHENRSAKFMRNNIRSMGFVDAQMDICEQLINCTNLNVNIDDIQFADVEIETLGKIVASADLLGQMADRHYLEKLVLLFKEFEEAGIPGFASEEELLEKTEGFYKNVAKKRLTKDLGNVSKYMKFHFKDRWNINRDLYDESIKNNIGYLKSMLSHGKKDKAFYQQYLKRGGGI